MRPLNVSFIGSGTGRWSIDRTYNTEYLQDYLASISGPIVLVGPSYGGAVITDAATGNANVKALVYDNAYIPAFGENVTTLSTAQSALAPAVNDPASVFKLVQYPQPPAPGVVDTYLLPGVASDFDVSRAEQALLTATQSPTSLAALGQASTEPAWKTIPSWDVIGRQDKIIPEAAQLMMAHRAGSSITEISSSHVSLISHPAEVAAVILKAARATSCPLRGAGTASRKPRPTPGPGTGTSRSRSLSPACGNGPGQSRVPDPQARRRRGRRGREVGITACTPGPWRNRPFRDLQAPEFGAHGGRRRPGIRSRNV